MSKLSTYLLKEKRIEQRAAGALSGDVLLILREGKRLNGRKVDNSQSRKILYDLQKQYIHEAFNLGVEFGRWMYREEKKKQAAGDPAPAPTRIESIRTDSKNKPVVILSRTALFNFYFDMFLTDRLKMQQARAILIKQHRSQGYSIDRARTAADVGTMEYRFKLELQRQTKTLIARCGMAGQYRGLSVDK